MTQKDGKHPTLQGRQSHAEAMQNIQNMKPV